MNDPILVRIEKQSYLKIEESELINMLKTCHVHEEYDTLISDYIRILEIKNQILVQEKSTKGEILLRKCDSLFTAQEFIRQRMIIYDKMWDGCGCKVDYYT